MELYMNKTLELANQLLSMRFGGEYKLLPFIINSNEFRIPFIGNGLAVDDLSSASSSQKAMFSRVINMSVLFQASTKYNITQLDEPTGPLDHINVENFSALLYRLLEILGFEQIFIISQTELNLPDAAIIRLRDYENYDLKGNNVIWDYNEIIKGNTI